MSVVKNRKEIVTSSEFAEEDDEEEEIGLQVTVNKNWGDHLIESWRVT
jgi:hypothetical protein